MAKVAHATCAECGPAVGDIVGHVVRCDSRGVPIFHLHGGGMRSVDCSGQLRVSCERVLLPAFSTSRVVRGAVRPDDLCPCLVDVFF